MYTNTESLDLDSFREQFNKKHKPNTEFVYRSKDITDKLSRLLEGQCEELTRQFITELSDYLEVQLSNSQFVDRLEVVEKPSESVSNKRVACMEHQGESGLKRKKFNNEEPITTAAANEKYYAKTDQFKNIDMEKKTAKPKPIKHEDVGLKKKENIAILTPLKVKVKENEEEEEGKGRGRVKNGLFSSHWAKAQKRTQAVQFIQGIVDEPQDWIINMETRYEAIVGDDNPANYDFSTMKYTPKQLARMYGELEPKNFHHIKDVSKESRLNARIKQNWVAVALYFTVIETYPNVNQQRKCFEDLRYLARKDPLPPKFAASVNTLMRHCKEIYQFYEVLGDVVIFTPELFEKNFFTQYPMRSRQELIDKLKNLLPSEIMDFKRFL